MSLNNQSGGPVEARSSMDRVYSGIASTSMYLTFLAIMTMMIVMIAEVFMRYVVGQPLGWNISLIENILMPGLVFIGLPYAYSVGAHVAAELIYDRVPESWKTLFDWIRRALLILCLSLLTYAGAAITIKALLDGSIPPPHSSQVYVPTWTWRALLPVGALSMLVLVVIDIVRPAKIDRSAS